MKTSDRALCCDEFVSGWGLIYFYLIAATRNGWMAVGAGIVGFAGLYWLWDEHVDASPRLGN